MFKISQVSHESLYLSVPTLVSFVLALFSPSIGVAGPGLSGGGQGVVCRNSDGTVKSAELLDLAEAEKYYLLHLSDNSTATDYREVLKQYAAVLDQSIPYSDPTSGWSISEGDKTIKRGFDINAAIYREHTGNYKDIIESANQIDQTKMLIPGDDFKIPPVADSNPHIIPTAQGCGIEQIAVYSDGDGKVRFVESVWEKMDNTNRAALLIHESLYRVLRLNGETSSDRARKTIAYLFSGLKFKWIIEGLPKQFLMCWTTDQNASFRFALVPGQGNHATAYFLSYAGETMMTRTVGSLPLAPFTGYFGLPQISLQNESIIQTIENPLLELPDYNFSVMVDNKTGEPSISLEAIQLAAGLHLMPIQCGEALNSVTIGNDGSVEVSTRH